MTKDSKNQKLDITWDFVKSYPFPYKLWLIIQLDYTSFITWNSDGTSVIIELWPLQEYLLSPLSIFKIKSLKGFIRHLKDFNFKEISKDLLEKDYHSFVIYKHEYFIRNRSDLISKIQKVQDFKFLLEESFRDCHISKNNSSDSNANLKELTTNDKSQLIETNWNDNEKDFINKKPFDDKQSDIPSSYKNQPKKKSSLPDKKLNEKQIAVKPFPELLQRLDLHQNDPPQFEKDVSHKELSSEIDSIHGKNYCNDHLHNKENINPYNQTERNPNELTDTTNTKATEENVVDITKESQDPVEILKNSLKEQIQEFILKKRSSKNCSLSSYPQFLNAELSPFLQQPFYQQLDPTRGVSEQIQQRNSSLISREIIKNHLVKWSKDTLKEPYEEGNSEMNQSNIYLQRSQSFYQESSLADYKSSQNITSSQHFPPNNDPKSGSVGASSIATDFSKNSSLTSYQTWEETRNLSMNENDYIQTQERQDEHPNHIPQNINEMNLADWSVSNINLNEHVAAANMQNNYFDNQTINVSEENSNLQDNSLQDRNNKSEESSHNLESNNSNNQNSGIFEVIYLPPNLQVERHNNTDNILNLLHQNEPYDFQMNLANTFMTSQENTQQDSQEIMQDWSNNFNQQETENYIEPFNQLNNEQNTNYFQENNQQNLDLYQQQDQSENQQQTSFDHDESKRCQVKEKFNPVISQQSSFHLNQMDWESLDLKQTKTFNENEQNLNANQPILQHPHDSSEISFKSMQKPNNCNETAINMNNNQQIVQNVPDLANISFDLVTPREDNSNENAKNMDSNKTTLQNVSDLRKIPIDIKQQQKTSDTTVANNDNKQQIPENVLNVAASPLNIIQQPVNSNETTAQDLANVSFKTAEDSYNNQALSLSTVNSNSEIYAKKEEGAGLNDHIATEQIISKENLNRHINTEDLNQNSEMMYQCESSIMNMNSTQVYQSLQNDQMLKIHNSTVEIQSEPYDLSYRTSEQSPFADSNPKRATSQLNSLEPRYQTFDSKTEASETHQDQNLTYIQPELSGLQDQSTAMQFQSTEIHSQNSQLQAHFYEIGDQNSEFHSNLAHSEPMQYIYDPNHNNNLKIQMENSQINSGYCEYQSEPPYQVNPNGTHLIPQYSNFQNEAYQLQYDYSGEQAGPIQLQYWPPEVNPQNSEMGIEEPYYYEQHPNQDQLYGMQYEQLPENSQIGQYELQYEQYRMPLNQSQIEVDNSQLLNSGDGVVGANVGFMLHQEASQLEIDQPNMKMGQSDLKNKTDIYSDQTQVETQQFENQSENLLEILDNSLNNSKKLEKQSHKKSLINNTTNDPIQSSMIKADVRNADGEIISPFERNDRGNRKNCLQRKNFVEEFGDIDLELEDEASGTIQNPDPQNPNVLRTKFRIRERVSHYLDTKERLAIMRKEEQKRKKMEKMRSEAIGGTCWDDYENFDYNFFKMQSQIDSIYSKCISNSTLQYPGTFLETFQKSTTKAIAFKDLVPNFTEPPFDGINIEELNYRKNDFCFKKIGTIDFTHFHRAMHFIHCRFDGESRSLKDKFVQVDKKCSKLGYTPKPEDNSIPVNADMYENPHECASIITTNLGKDVAGFYGNVTMSQLIRFFGAHLPKYESNSLGEMQIIVDLPKIVEPVQEEAANEKFSDDSPEYEFPSSAFDEFLLDDNKSDDDDEMSQDDFDNNDLFNSELMSSLPNEECGMKSEDTIEKTPSNPSYFFQNLCLLPKSESAKATSVKNYEEIENSADSDDNSNLDVDAKAMEYLQMKRIKRKSKDQKIKNIEEGLEIEIAKNVNEHGKESQSKDNFEDFVADKDLNTEKQNDINEAMTELENYLKIVNIDFK